MDRFRPNIVVAGADLAAWAEDAWQRIRVGGAGGSGATFSVVKPCDRCKAGQAARSLLRCAARPACLRRRPSGSAPSGPGSVAGAADQPADCQSGRLAAHRHAPQAAWRQGAGVDRPPCLQALGFLCMELDDARRGGSSRRGRRGQRVDGALRRALQELRIGLRVSLVGLLLTSALPVGIALMEALGGRNKPNSAEIEKGASKGGAHWRSLALRRPRAGKLNGRQVRLLRAQLQPPGLPGRKGKLPMAPEVQTQHPRLRHSHSTQPLVAGVRRGRGDCRAGYQRSRGRRQQPRARRAHLKDRQVVRVGADDKDSLP